MTIKGEIAEEFFMKTPSGTIDVDEGTPFIAFDIKVMSICRTDIAVYVQISNREKEWVDFGLCFGTESLPVVKNFIRERGIKEAWKFLVTHFQAKELSIL